MDYTSSPQSISWFKDRYLEGNLEIRPPYQRKPVWVARQRSSLVETILFGLPIPEVFIQRSTTPTGETTYALVDGQQRIRTILQFIGVETGPEEQEHNRFALDRLDTDSLWSNVAFDDLDDDQRVKFFDYQITVRYLLTNDETQVRDMFRRLNKFLTPLKPQELRNAIYTGPFIRLATRLADDEYWAINRVITPASIRRMGDIEFVSELLIGTMHGPQGGSQRIIDEYYEKYEDYESEFPDQRRIRALYDRILDTIQVIFPDISKHRWGNKTDFYTLFIALASMLRKKVLPKGKVDLMRERLINFAEEVDTRLADETAKVSQDAIEYVRAVEKGANMKQRRAARHSVMLRIIETCFEEKGES